MRSAESKRGLTASLRSELFFRPDHIEVRLVLHQRVVCPWRASQPPHHRRVREAPSSVAEKLPARQVALPSRADDDLHGQPGALDQLTDVIHVQLEGSLFGPPSVWWTGSLRCGGSWHTAI